VASNGEYPDTDAADLLVSRINILYLVVLKPRFMHREKHMNGLAQKFIVGSKMSAVEIFGARRSLKPRKWSHGRPNLEVGVTGIRQRVE
jgi:hypothetical protein